MEDFHDASFTEDDMDPDEDSDLDLRLCLFVWGGVFVLFFGGGSSRNIGWSNEPKAWQGQP